MYFIHWHFHDIGEDTTIEGSGSSLLEILDNVAAYLNHYRNPGNVTVTIVEL